MTSKSENIELDRDLEKSPRVRNFDWEKAKNFYYVAKCGSFANAARFLNISQSSLSRQVIYLEQHLECSLFSRHSGGLKLTRKGEELFTIVETTFIEFKGFTHHTHAQTTNGKKRKIRIATTHAITAYILDDLILAYNAEHSNLVFELITDDHLIDLILNDVDIAIRPYDPNARGVSQELLFTLERKLYASPSYLAEYGEPQAIEELKNHHIIAAAHPEEFPYADVSWILKLGLPPGQFHEPIFTSTAVESTIKAAKNGLGIVGGYEKMKNIKNSQLQNILSHVKGNKINEYFIYPDYLKEDKEIINLKDFLKSNLNP